MVLGRQNPFVSFSKKAAFHSLLPAGVRDILPPYAGFRSDVWTHLFQFFTQQGYRRVEAPLIEFEETLLAHRMGACPEILRLTDPLSQKIMGFRSDITPQIARIAATRLQDSPRPLRLAYSGDVLRAQGTQLYPERQSVQAGVELIGSQAVEADIEVIALAVEALESIGLTHLCLDFHYTPLIAQLFELFNVTPAQGQILRESLKNKDRSAVLHHAKDVENERFSAILEGLLLATGPARAGLMILTTMDLPPPLCTACDDLHRLISLLLEELPQIQITIDPVENRDVAYHNGVSFSLFTPNVRGELGRGGRYLVGTGEENEPATGFSLSMDGVLEALSLPEVVPCLYVPYGVSRTVGRALRQQGWITVVGLEEALDSRAEAVRLECTHLWRDGVVIELPTAAFLKKNSVHEDTK